MGEIQIEMRNLDKSGIIKQSLSLTPRVNTVRYEWRKIIGFYRGARKSIAVKQLINLVR